MASPSPAPDAVTQCPACGATSPGKFCSNCGTPFVADPASCQSCNATLSPGARFCHRCGTPAGTARPTDARSFSNSLPWAVAAIALLALIALIVGQQFGQRQTDAAPTTADAAPSGPTGAGPGTGGGSPPDISSMSPADAAVRLYNRVMGAHERGRADTVQLFAPMAITAYQMIENPDLDQRYDLGRIAAISGDDRLAKAQADTILARQPNHLLGLILAADAARMRKDSAAERAFHDRLVAAAPAERAKRLPEYITHENDITIALDAKRP